MVERELPKLRMRVRFPLSAPFQNAFLVERRFLHNKRRKLNTAQTPTVLTCHPQTNSGHPLGHVAPAGTVMFGLDPDIQVK